MVLFRFYEVLIFIHNFLELVGASDTNDPLITEDNSKGNKM